MVTSAHCPQSKVVLQDFTRYEANICGVTCMLAYLRERLSAQQPAACSSCAGSEEPRSSLSFGL